MNTFPAVRRVLALAVITGGVLAAGCADATPSRAQPARSASPAALAPETTAQLDAQFTAIRADGGASARLPDGRVLWVFGDTLQAGSQPICLPGNCPFGYPHDTLAVQSAPGAQDLTPLHSGQDGYAAGQFGYSGYQYLPNGSDGSWLWAGALIAGASHVYVICGRIAATASGSFTVVGLAVVEFSPALAYEGIVNTPAQTGALGVEVWSSAVRLAGGGYWLGGSDGASVKQGDVAFVPPGDLMVPSKWQIHAGVIPQADQPGTAVALRRTSTGTWQAFTKRGDAYGSNSVEELRAKAITGPWTVAKTWPAPVGAGDVSYAVSLHPEQPAPAGQVLLSYAVGGSFADYHLSFLQVAP
jgi:hypothetical protein